MRSTDDQKKRTKWHIAIEFVAFDGLDERYGLPKSDPDKIRKLISILRRFMEAREKDNLIRLLQE